jgi:FixJ family two-component response regulator
MAGIVAGAANKVIAHRLGISDKTVEKHHASLMKKMNARSVAELVRISMIAGITVDE